MEETELQNRIFSYAFYSLSVITFVASIITYNVYLILSVALVLLVGAVYSKSGHMVNNFLIRRSKIIEIYNGYKLDDGLASAVKNINGVYHSVSVATLTVDKEREDSHELIRSIIENTSEEFEFSIALRELDKKSILEDLETKRRVKEIAISKLGSGSYDKVNSMKRELGIIESEIKNIGQNGKPVEFLIRLRAFAKGSNEVDAASGSFRNLEQVANRFATALNLSYEIARGEALLKHIQ